MYIESNKVSQNPLDLITKTLAMNESLIPKKITYKCFILNVAKVWTLEKPGHTKSIEPKQQQLLHSYAIHPLFDRLHIPPQVPYTTSN
jgi:hypothetical protein